MQENYYATLAVKRDIRFRVAVVDFCLGSFTIAYRCHPNMQKWASEKYLDMAYEC
jgi:hypothetical protein